MTQTLLVYREGADWTGLQAAARSGTLPALAGLLRQGTAGRLRSPPPLDSWCLATTLATGRIAADHGVLSAQVQENDQLRPASSSTPAAPSVWQILARCGQPAGAINWPLSYPVPGDARLSLSDAYFQTRRISEQTLPPPPAAASHDIGEERASLRLHAADLDPFMLARLIAPLKLAALENDPRLSTFAVRLAEALSVFRLTRVCLATDASAFIAMRLPELRLPAPSPVQDSKSGHWIDDPEIYRQLRKAWERACDQILGALHGLLDNDASLLLVSAHQAQAQVEQMDPRHIEAAMTLSPEGFLLAVGGLARTQQQLLGASLLDVAPTLLRLRGLDPSSDMPGRVLTEAFELEPGTIGPASWSSLAVQIPGSADPEVLDDLLFESGQPVSDTTESLSQRHDVSRCMSLGTTGRAAEALGWLQTRYGDDGAENPALLRLQAHMLLDQRQLEPERIRRVIKALMRCGGLAFDEKLLLARLNGRTGAHREALKLLFSCLAEQPQHPALHLYIGREYFALGEVESASQAYQAVLNLSPHHFQAQLGLAEVALQNSDFAQAQTLALDAIESCFNEASPHLLLGQALEGLGQFQAATEAYLTAMRLNPMDLFPIKRLIHLYGPDGLDCKDQVRELNQRIGRLMAHRAMVGA